MSSINKGPLFNKGGHEELEALKKNDALVQEQIAAMPPETRSRILSAKAEVESAVAEMNSDLFDWEHEHRIRAKGLSIQQAEDLAQLIKTKKVGQLFSFRGTTKVVTPFKTVVDGQVYVDVLQNAVLDPKAVTSQLEIIDLKKSLNSFTNLTFLDLIKLAFKRILTKGNKNG